MSAEGPCLSCRDKILGLVAASGIGSGEFPRPSGLKERSTTESNAGLGSIGRVAEVEDQAQRLERWSTAMAQSDQLRETRNLG